MERPLALVIDRDPTAREQIRSVFEKHGVDALGASSSAETAEALSGRPVRVVVVDVQAPGIDMPDLIDRVQRTCPTAVVVAIAPSPDRSDSLVDAGAFDVLTRPLEGGRLHGSVRAALKYNMLLEELRALREDLQRREGYEGLVGRSPQMERLRDRIARLAAIDVPVWFCGEKGSGKEHAARELHARSSRASSRFEVLPCGGLEGETWNARLGLGAKGRVDGDGLLAVLQGGTLYLEDLGAQPPDVQSGLLPVLDAARAPAVDVRIVAASTEDPRALAEQGRLLDELRGKLAGETLTLPPLRERSEDVPLLARHFIRTICVINQLPRIELDSEALALLERHRWPDNVQGLRNALEQAAILSPDGKIRPRDLPDGVRDPAGPSPPPGPGGPAAPRRFREAKREVVEGFERRYLRELMERHGGNVTAASQQAGMLRSALQRLLRKYGLKSADFRRQRQVVKPGAALRPRD